MSSSAEPTDGLYHRLGRSVSVSDRIHVGIGLLCGGLTVIQMDLARASSVRAEDVWMSAGLGVALGVFVAPYVLDRWRIGDTRHRSLFYVALLASLTAPAGGLVLLAWTVWRSRSTDFALDSLFVSLAVWATILLAKRHARRNGLSRRDRFHVDTLFPARLRTRMPLSAAVGITRHNGFFGNGFLVHCDGFVVTANHVVRGPDSVFVTLRNGDVFQGRVVARHPEHDLALVRITVPYRLPVATLGTNRRHRLGARVTVVGWEPPESRDITDDRPGHANGVMHCWEPTVIPLSITSICDVSPQGFATMMATGSDVVRPGYSGSAVCDPRTGRVVAMYGWSRVDVNQHGAFPSELIGDFLRECGVRPRSSLLWQMPTVRGKTMSRQRMRAEALLACANLLEWAGFGQPEMMREWPRERLEDIRDGFDQYVAATPEIARVWTIRALVRAVLDDPEGAEADARRAIAIGGPFDGLAFSVLQQRLLRACRWEDAERAARSYLGGPLPAAMADSDRHLLPACIGLSRALYGAGRFEESTSVCETTLALIGPLGLIDWTLHILEVQARALAAMGDLPAAMTCYREALTLPGWSGSVLVDMLETLVAMGGEEDCREAVAVGMARISALDRVPQGAYGTLSRAFTLLRQEDLAAWAARMELACAGPGTDTEPAGATPPDPLGGRA